MTNDKPPVQTLSFQELRAAEFPPDNYIIGDGLLPANGLLFIAGPPKAYKSFVMNTVIYHLLVGTPLFGAHRKPHGRTEMALCVACPQRVLLLEQEIGFYDVRERLLPLWLRLPPHEQIQLDQNLYIHSRDHTMRLDTKEGTARIERIIAAACPTVVCFDPLIEFHGRDENDAQEMTFVLRNLDLLRNKYGFAVIMSHHTGKPDPAKFRSGPDQLRGSSIVYGKGDSFLMLTVVNRNAGILRVDTTVRRGPPILPMRLILDWGQLRAGFHEWIRAKADGSEGMDERRPV